MRIASSEPKGPRTHTVADQAWTFARETADGPLVCDVTSDAAVAIFLAPHNRGTFYALGDLPTLTRVPVAPAPPPPPDESHIGYTMTQAIELLLARRGQPEFADDFTTAGVPNCNALSALVGFPVRKAAMLEAWNALDPAAFGGTATE